MPTDRKINDKASSLMLDELSILCEMVLILRRIEEKLDSLITHDYDEPQKECIRTFPGNTG